MPAQTRDTRPNTLIVLVRCVDKPAQSFNLAVPNSDNSNGTENNVSNVNNAASTLLYQCRSSHHSLPPPSTWILRRIPATNLRLIPRPPTRAVPREVTPLSGTMTASLTASNQSILCGGGQKVGIS